MLSDEKQQQFNALVKEKFNALEEKKLNDLKESLPELHNCFLEMLLNGAHSDQNAVVQMLKYNEKKLKEIHDDIISALGNPQHEFRYKESHVIFAKALQKQQPSQVSHVRYITLKAWLHRVMASKGVYDRLNKIERLVDDFPYEPEQKQSLKELVKQEYMAYITKSGTYKRMLSINDECIEDVNHFVSTVNHIFHLYNKASSHQQKQQSTVQKQQPVAKQLSHVDYTRLNASLYNVMKLKGLYHVTRTGKVYNRLNKINELVDDLPYALEKKESLKELIEQEYTLYMTKNGDYRGTTSKNDECIDCVNHFVSTVKQMFQYHETPSHQNKPHRQNDHQHKQQPVAKSQLSHVNYTTLDEQLHNIMRSNELYRLNKINGLVDGFPYLEEKQSLKKLIEGEYKDYIKKIGIYKKMSGMDDEYIKDINRFVSNVMNHMSQCNEAPSHQNKPHRQNDHQHSKYCLKHPSNKQNSSNNWRTFSQGVFVRVIYF